MKFTGMKSALLAAAASAALAPSAALAVAGDEVDWILNMRLRGETVDQAGFVNEAEALTLRTRFGVQGGFGEGFKFLVEGENIIHIIDDFNDTTNGLTSFPVIADPETTELNRLQLSYDSGQGFNTTIGRQRVIRGDARYIGNVGFRQNEQTFDAVTLNFPSSDDLSVSYTYLDRVHRIFGEDSPAGEWDLNAHTVWASYEAGPGTLSAFAIVADVDEVATLSTNTWGLNFSGQRGGEGGPVWSYMFEYASQSDYTDNPDSFALDMIRAELGVTTGPFNVRAGIEQLEGNGARGFSTPFATLHKFQGWADAFLATPADGIRDRYLRGGYTFAEAPFGESLSAAIIWHDFEAENGGADLGSEIDAVVSSRLTDTVSLEFKAAFFDGGDAGPADRDKLWIGLTYNR